MTCEDNSTIIGMTNYSEIYISEKCDIPVIGLLIIEILVIAFGIISFAINGILLIIRWKFIKKKKKHPKIFLFWSCIANLLVIIRPIVVLATGSYAWHNLWHLYLVNISAFIGASVVIYFVYIEINIIKNSELKKTKYSLTKYQVRAVFILPIPTFIMYILTPIGSYYGLYSASVAYLIPTLTIVLVIIPYLCISGLKIYFKIHEMVQTHYQKISRHILNTVIFCTILGTGVAAVSILGILNFKYSWVLLVMPWLLFVPFNTFIFSLILRKPVKYRSNEEKSTTRSSARIDASTNKPMPAAPASTPVTSTSVTSITISMSE